MPLADASQTGQTRSCRYLREAGRLDCPKAKYYIRYADDFVIFSENRQWLENQIPTIQEFLLTKLKLEFHPQKVFIKTLASGVDFLGWVHFLGHRVLRTSTKRRMVKRVLEISKPETLTSYFGLLRHGNTYKIREQIHEKYQAISALHT